MSSHKIVLIKMWSLSIWELLDVNYDIRLLQRGADFTSLITEYFKKFEDKKNLKKRPNRLKLSDYPNFFTVGFLDEFAYEEFNKIVPAQITKKDVHASKDIMAITRSVASR